MEVTDPRSPNPKHSSETVGDIESNSELDHSFAAFISKAKLTPDNATGKDAPTVVNMLRDTGASQTLLLEGTIKTGPDTHTGDHVIVTGVNGVATTLPLHRVKLDSDLIKRDVVVGLTATLPVAGVQLLLGNDVAGSKVVMGPNPIVTEKVVESAGDEALEDEFPDIFPACVVTRSKAKEKTLNQREVDLGKTFMANLDSLTTLTKEGAPFTRDKLIESQDLDPETKELKTQTLSQGEANKVPNCFYLQNKVLMRKWRSPFAKANHDRETKHQIVVPTCAQPYVLQIAHEAPMSGHLGVRT